MSSESFGRLFTNLRGAGGERNRKRFNTLLQAKRRRERHSHLRFEVLEKRQLLAASLSINDPMVIEGNSGSVNLDFTVTRSGDTLSAITVAYSTSDSSPAAGAATAGSDYTATSGTVTIPSGDTTATISVPVQGDISAETNEELFVNLTGITNVTGPAVTLADKTDLTTGNPDSVAIGDLNGDGLPDLVIANAGSDTVSVLLNTTALGATTPTYATQADFLTGDAPREVAIGDLNGDGRPDLAIANVNSDSVSVLINTTMPGAAAPTFATQEEFTTGTSPYSVAIGDLNGDGRPDLAIANAISANVTVLLNTTMPGATTPTYAAKTDFNTGFSPFSVAIGDLNGDGRPDLAIANYGSNSVSVLLNTTTPGATTPSYVAKTDFTAGTRPYSLAIGDLNGDGRPDLAIANRDSNNLSVLLNTTTPGATTPSYADQTILTTGDAPISVAIRDLNGDGKPELAIANAGSDTVSVLLNTTTAGATTASFADKTDFTTGAAPSSVAIGDLNGDGQPDLAIANLGDGNVSVLLNTTILPTASVDVGPRTDFTTGNGTFSVATGDFNNDGRPDLAITNRDSDSVSVLLNTTTPGANTPSYADKTDFNTGDDPRSVSIGDLNGDGRPDLAIANQADGTVSVLLSTTTPGATSPSFAAKTDFPTGTSPLSVAIGDLNGDGKPDLAIANAGSNKVSVLLNTTMTGATTPSYAASDLTTGTTPFAVAIGDLNGDGLPDLAIANAGSNNVSVLINMTALGSTTPTYVTKADFITETNPRSVAIGDLNGDGLPDLAIANAGSDSVSVLINTTTPGASTPTYATKGDFTTGSLPRSVAIGDLNGDGRPDLAIANTGSNNVTVLLNTTTPGSTTPSYAAQTDFTTGIDPYSVTIGDLNGDGKPDLAVANYVSSSVSVLLNNPATISDNQGTGTIVNDDIAGFTISKTTATVSEDGTTTTDLFTVVLNAQPLSDVVLDLSLSATPDAAIDKMTLTFTDADWNVPQTVNVTGLNDDIDDGDEVTTITVAVNDTASDDTFDPLADQTVVVTTTDDDTAGFTLSKTTATVSEDGTTTTDSFTVVLDAQPLTDVVLDLSLTATPDAAIDKMTLTFTNADWNVPQTVNVTGLNDDSDDGDEETTITVAVDDTASDDTFDPLADQTVTVTTTDDETVGFTLSKTTATVSEDGTTTTDSFTVVLDAQPLTDVVLDLSLTATPDVAIDKMTLTFTNADWNVPQTVNVTGLNDDSDDGDEETTITVAVNGAASDDTFDSLADQTVTVTTTDDETVGFTLSKTTATVSEDGTTTTDSFTVVLDAQPLTDVVLDLSLTAAPDVAIDKTTLTFTNADWNVPQSVNVTGLNDDIDDGDEQTTVTVAVNDTASDDTFDSLADQMVTVTTTDDETAGFTLSKTTATVSEDGTTTTDSFTVVLDAQPLTDVVLDLSLTATPDAAIDKTTLTFTNADWNIPQTVNVTGLNDDIDDGDEETTITVAVNGAASDDTFDSLADQTVTVTTTDDETVGFTLSKTTATVSEDGTTTTDSFTVALDAQPLTDVVLDLSLSTDPDVAIDMSMLTFTNANWDVPQTVNVTGLNDDIDDGDEETTITVAVNDTASDDTFDSLADQTVTVTTTDDETAGFTLSKTIATVSEDGTTTTDSFTVVLDAQPLTDVVLDLSLSTDPDVAIDMAMLTFTNADWNVPQTVNVSGLNDDIVDGDEQTTVTVAVNDTASDDTFDSLADQTVTVTTTDDETAGFTLSKTIATVSEDGTTTTDSFTVVLDAQPLTDVVLDLSLSTDPDVAIDMAMLTFTNANWDVPQTVNVSGLNDDIVDGDEQTAITVAVNDTASDDAFDSLADQTVTVTTTDDETAGFTLSKTIATVSEDGTTTTDSFTVVLDAQPLTDVVLDLSLSTDPDVAIDMAMLTFTNANWDQPQTVNVSGLNDDIVDGDEQTAITVAVNDTASDDAFDPLADQTVTVTTTDDETVGFTLSKITAIVSEDGITTTDSFTVVLTTQPVSDVVLDLSLSTDPDAAIDMAMLTFTNANWDQPQTVNVTGLNDDIVDGDEQTTITVAVNDTASDDAFDPLADQTVTVTTTDDDTAAVTVEDVSVAEGGGLLFTVSLDIAVQGGFTVDVSLADVTATGGAAPLVSPVDYDNVVAQLSFTGTAGETQQFTVATLDDAVAEPTETFTVSLSASNPLVTDSDTATGTITDNDGTAVLDVTGTGNPNPFQDGILIVRFMFDQPDANLEDPALIPAGATRTTGAEIRAFLGSRGRCSRCEWRWADQSVPRRHLDRPFSVRST